MPLSQTGDEFRPEFSPIQLVGASLRKGAELRKSYFEELLNQGSTQEIT